MHVFVLFSPFLKILYIGGQNINTLHWCLPKQRKEEPGAKEGDKENEVDVPPLEIPSTMVIYDLSPTDDDTSTAAVKEVGPLYIDQTHDCGFKSIDDKISLQEEQLKTPGYLALC